LTREKYCKVCGQESRIERNQSCDFCQTDISFKIVVVFGKGNAMECSIRRGNQTAETAMLIIC
jgi:hypothetical protein